MSSKNRFIFCFLDFRFLSLYKFKTCLMSTIQVIEPTMVLNEDICKSNIARMAAKAKAANVVFRPHFKTHQSREIGEFHGHVQ